MVNGIPKGVEVTPASHSRRPLLIASITLILAILVLIAWQQGLFSGRDSSGLTEAEIAEIQAFLSRQASPPSATEAAAIDEYLSSAPNNLTESEKAQILDYLQ